MAKINLAILVRVWLLSVICQKKKNNVRVV